MPIQSDEKQHVRRLAALVAITKKVGARRMTEEQLVEFPKLYRYASSLLARLETGGHDPKALAELRPLLVEAHGLLYRAPRAGGRFGSRALAFFVHEAPRAIRAEWKLVAATFAIVYGLAIVSFVVVLRDLELAYSLFSPAAVDQEIELLRATEGGEPFRGNFTFGLGESPSAAGAIMGNNMKVAVLFFALGLVPPLYLLAIATNGLMLGTYTGVAAHWDQAGAISSILWCHGVLEIQALVLAGTGGLVLLRAWIAPGPWSRAHAMRIESARAWRLLAPTFPILFVSGLIEGFVSPHAPLAVRIGVAVLTGALLAAWIAYGGRAARTGPAPP